YRETPPYARGKVARYYLAAAPSGEVSLPVSGELGRPEHHEFRWLSRDQAQRLLGERLCPILDWAHRRVTAG
ncbi:MAG TPA: NUDIX hydrolase, partial [Thermoanaerobaculia bacterium]|nr:NUDIX hydrolase [Thermoanaerobaculia bacterium]